MKMRQNIRVEGKVQGVYFRKSTFAKAVELGLTGTVKNQSDGSVYIEAEGFQGQLDLFIEWCYHGPVMAKVSKITVEGGALQGFTSFKII